MNMSRIFRTLTPLVLAPFVCAAGCSNSTKNVVTAGGESLSKVTPATAAACPSGGTTIATGTDANGNGVLDDSEVTSTSNICNGTSTTGTNGTSGPSSLVSTTTLPAGDPNCVAGGVEIQTGLDNGAGGGTANDGILQKGEVTSTQYVCSYPGPRFPSTNTPPDGAGSSTITANGGDTTLSDNSAGSGGSFDAEIDEGTLGGHVAVYKTGTVDATFKLPTYTANVGSTPCTITAANGATAANPTLVTIATLPGQPEHGEQAAGTCYLLKADRNLYIVTASGSTVASSFTVGANTKVTLTQNFDDEQESFFQVAGDISIAGVLTASRLADDVSSLAVAMQANVVSIATTGSIDVTGLDGTTGGNSLGLQLYANAMYLQGPIDASGGAGSDSGGSGGSVTFSCGGAVYATSTITANGGTGTNVQGGSAGSVDFEVSNGAAYVSGALTANGGSGYQSSSGGTITINQNIGAGVVNSGAITARGGACTDSNDGCTAGSGGSVSVVVDGGAITTNGAIDVSGGAGAPYGGSGGTIRFSSVSEESNSVGLPVVAGSIHVAGNLAANGGSGAQSTGGSITAELSPNDAVVGQDITFYGYASISANGGSGGTVAAGGAGGSIELRQDEPSSSGGIAGSAINYAALSARGGSGTSGGNGGYVSIRAQTESVIADAVEIALNAGAVDLSGGAGSGDGGGDGGNFSMRSSVSTTNTGVIDASGGADTTTNASGGSGGYSEMVSAIGPVTSSGALTAGGGNGDSFGGRGGTLQFSGDPVTNSVAVTANGGNAASTTGAGGAGGSITLQSFPVGPTVLASGSSLTASAGTGGAASAGTILVDNVRQ